MTAVAMPGPVPGPPLRDLIPQRVLITGVTGQTGSYLAQRLVSIRGPLADGTVWGMVRGQSVERRQEIQALVPGIRLVEGDLLDQGSLIRALHETDADAIYHLAAISAPGLCWSQPVLASEVTGLGTLRLLEAVSYVAPEAKVLVAGSIASHGPYGAAKTFSRAIATDYRQRGLKVSTALLGGHHSPRRGIEFFSRKVSLAAARIGLGVQEGLTLGGLERFQDWGWADDFADALVLAMRHRDVDEFTISTGRPHSMAEWVAACFGAVKLDWRDHVNYDETLSQPTEPERGALSADPDERLGWTPHRDLAGLATWMVHADRDRLKGER